MGTTLAFPLPSFLGWGVPRAAWEEQGWAAPGRALEARVGRRCGDPTGPHPNQDGGLPKGTEHRQESWEKIKVTNDLTVPLDGCGLQQSSGQIGSSCQISYELGFLGSVVAIVTVRNKYQVSSAWHELGAVPGRPTHFPTEFS